MEVIRNMKKIALILLGVLIVLTLCGCRQVEKVIPSPSPTVSPVVSPVPSITPGVSESPSATRPGESPDMDESPAATDNDTDIGDVLDPDDKGNG